MTEMADAGALTNRMGGPMAQPDYAGVSKLRGREPTPCCDAAAKLARIREAWDAYWNGPSNYDDAMATLKREIES